MGGFTTNSFSVLDSERFINWEHADADGDDNDGGWNALTKNEKGHTSIAIETQNPDDIVLPLFSIVGVGVGIVSCCRLSPFKDVGYCAVVST